MPATVSSVMPEIRPDPPVIGAVQIESRFGDLVIGSHLLSDGNGGGPRDGRSAFVVGWDRSADAPVAAPFVSGPAHELVRLSPLGCTLSLTPQMTGEIIFEDHTQTLPAASVQHSAPVLLPASAHALIRCGACSFHVRPTFTPPLVERPPWRQRLPDLRHLAVSTLVLGLFALVAAFVPPDRNALSLDVMQTVLRALPVTIKPPEFPAVDAAAAAGSTGATAAPSAGVPASRRSARDPGGKVRRTPAPQPAPQNTGLLRALDTLAALPAGNIFRPQSAIGDVADNVLDGLQGAIDPGNAFELGGFKLASTGWIGAGGPDRTIGLDPRGTIGSLGPPGVRNSYGVDNGPLARHTVKAIAVEPGTPLVRGHLDKEIVRRVIRHHLNEVKYCYERELLHKPTLAGRLLVKFVIGATGQVASSVVESSTTAHPPVDACVAEAVRRWTFPSVNSQGGLVIVSYPFVLAPAGGGR